MGNQCLSVDLEVGVRDTRIHAFSGVRSDTGQSLTFSNSTGLAAALAKLDDLADGVDFLLGHNLIAFDLPHLQAANPGLRLFGFPRWTRSDSIRWPFPATPTIIWSSTTRTEGSGAGVSTTQNWMPDLP